MPGSFSIKQRIWGAFLVLVMIFVVNGIITVVTLNRSKALSETISTVIDPIQQYVQDLKKLVVESKMYTTNWVFLRSDFEDKRALQRIQVQAYPRLRNDIVGKFSLLESKRITDSLTYILKDFDRLIGIQKEIMGSLVKFEDYDDPLKKMLAEQIIEDQVIPATADILQSIDRLETKTRKIKAIHYGILEKYSIRLRLLIPVLAIVTICIGILMSVYFIRVITKPLEQIRQIIKDLGQGIINKIERPETNDEIGAMIKKVNNLSDKLRETSLFAQHIGNRNYDVPFSPLSDKDMLGKSLIAMRDNIRESEEALLQANAELKKSNGELDKFVYSVSHDLRAPLSSMLGVISIIEADISDANVLDDLMLLKNSVNKLDSFIVDILNYSRNSRMEVVAEEIDFKDILKDVQDNLKYMAIESKPVEIRTDISAGHPFYSDRMRFFIILNNLISNAIRYSNPKEAVPYVSISIATSETCARIVVEDNGIGISKGNKDKVFEMFYRVSKKSVGSGLGLYLVKETVQKLHGNLQMESEPGKGTTITIVIPNEHSSVNNNNGATNV